MSSTELNQVLAELKQAHLQHDFPSLELRRDRLQRSQKLLLQNREALIDAINQDFGHRSAYQSLASDILATVGTLAQAEAQVAEWMKADTVANDYAGMHSEVQYQPLGVVGVISPWNFPLNLAFGPLAGIFAAGNTAMLKPSELTPATSALLAELVPQYFSETELRVITGDADVGIAFSQLAFDHLVFTGSTNVGRHVMRAAAENLVPVTLELGGKSPVVIREDFDLATAVARTFTIKTFNSGQICVSPDYVMLPQALQAAFVQHAQAFMNTTFSTFFDNEDYTSIVNDRHFSRLVELVEDAKVKGADIVHLSADGAFYDQAQCKIVPTLVLNVTEDMKIMQEEIFGPLLPVKNYNTLDQAIAYINANPHPLAAYYFGENEADQQQFAQQTTSGSLVVNDVMSHMVVDTLPFGGVGHSGIGAYHGIHGFRRFSHAKAFVKQSENGESNLRLRAPYAEKMIEAQALFN